MQNLANTFQRGMHRIKVAQVLDLLRLDTFATLHAKLQGMRSSLEKIDLINEKLDWFMEGKVADPGYFLPEN